MFIMYIGYSRSYSWMTNYIVMVYLLIRDRVNGKVIILKISPILLTEV